MQSRTTDNLNSTNVATQSVYSETDLVKRTWPFTDINRIFGQYIDENTEYIKITDILPACPQQSERCHFHNKREVKDME